MPTLAFTATEYELLKKELAPHTSVWNWMLSCLGSFQSLGYLTYPAFFIASFFITSSAKSIGNTLQFDFNSLITALNTYVTDNSNLKVTEYMVREGGQLILIDDWLNVGKAQRDVPAHIAHEYCRGDRSFDTEPSFNEKTLPRCLTFDNYRTNSRSWFPLTSSSSGLGFDFGVGSNEFVTGGRAMGVMSMTGMEMQCIASALVDLVAVSSLDTVRKAELKQSREILAMASANDNLRPS